jgi:hypothetical protein
MSRGGHGIRRSAEYAKTGAVNKKENNCPDCQNSSVVLSKQTAEKHHERFQS